MTEQIASPKEMQAAIDQAVSKGFIVNENTSLESNYEGAVGFNALTPEQQSALAASTEWLKKPAVPALYSTIEQVPPALRDYIQKYYFRTNTDDLIELANIIEGWARTRTEATTELP
jgi:hypothetical protein